jgi:hypothetical protein
MVDLGVRFGKFRELFAFKEDRFSKALLKWADYFQ